MSDIETNPTPDRRPACDNCKTRKTKCDRRSPCASCVTLKVACQITGNSTEKRQRVLLSTKYEEAVQDVKHQLTEVKGMLETLVLANSQPSHSPGSTEKNPGQLQQTSRPAIDEQVPSLSSISEGFTGDSSFQSHAYKVRSALEKTLAASHFINVQDPSIAYPQRVKELLRGADTAVSSVSNTESVLEQRAPDFENPPLPPVDIVLKVLRRANVEKQRFFVDTPIFQETEFTNMCRDIYFATEPALIWPWISVNVGLYFLLLNVNEVDASRLGTSTDEVHSHCALLRKNLEKAMQSLRLCANPTTESCRAMCILGTYYAKEGNNTIAWRLVSGAARGALDLGMHRVPTNHNTPELSKKRHIFWHIYCWDKGLAISCGRTPVILPYDVTTVSPMAVEPQGQVEDRIYGAWIEYTIISGEIQQSWFSAASQHITKESRFQQAKTFAARLKDNQEVARKTPYENELSVTTYSGVVASLEILTYSLLTIVYRVLPPNFVQSHPLQCSYECVEAARMGLTMLVRIGDAALKISPNNWTQMLNVILSNVPFVSFLVLAGNAIATCHSEDLDLLSSVLFVLEPSAAHSLTVRRVYEACGWFQRVAELVVSNGGSMDHAHCISAQDSNAEISLDPVTTGSNMQNHTANPTVAGFPMAQEGWDSIMMEYESEIGECDSRALTSVLEPFITQAYWQ